MSRSTLIALSDVSLDMHRTRKPYIKLRPRNSVIENATKGKQRVVNILPGSDGLYECKEADEAAVGIQAQDDLVDVESDADEEAQGGADKAQHVDPDSYLVHQCSSPHDGEECGQTSHEHQHVQDERCDPPQEGVQDVLVVGGGDHQLHNLDGRCVGVFLAGRVAELEN